MTNNEKDVMALAAEIHAKYLGWLCSDVSVDFARTLIAERNKALDEAAEAVRRLPPTDTYEEADGQFAALQAILALKDKTP